MEDLHRQIKESKENEARIQKDLSATHSCIRLQNKEIDERKEVNQHLRKDKSGLLESVFDVEKEKDKALVDLRRKDSALEKQCSVVSVTEH